MIDRPRLRYNIAMKRILHIFGRLLIAMVFLGAAWLLYDRLRHYTLRQILDAMADISAWHIAAACC